MKKKVTRNLAVILLAIMLFNTVAFAAIKEPDATPQMTYIMSTSLSLDKGVLSTTVSSYIKCTDSVTSVKIKMELQKLSSGTYSTIQTWEQTFSGREALMEKNKLTSLTNTYRLKTTFTAYSGSSSETKTAYAYE